MKSRFPSILSNCLFIYLPSFNERMSYSATSLCKWVSILLGLRPMNKIWMESPCANTRLFIPFLCKLHYRLSALINDEGMRWFLPIPSISRIGYFIHSESTSFMTSLCKWLHPASNNGASLAATSQSWIGFGRKRWRPRAIDSHWYLTFIGPAAPAGSSFSFFKSSPTGGTWTLWPFFFFLKMLETSARHKSHAKQIGR